MPQEALCLFREVEFQTKRNERPELRLVPEPKRRQKDRKIRFESMACYSEVSFRLRHDDPTEEIALYIHSCGEETDLSVASLARALRRHRSEVLPAHQRHQRLTSSEFRRLPTARLIVQMLSSLFYDLCEDVESIIVIEKQIGKLLPQTRSLVMLAFDLGERLLKMMEDCGMRGSGSAARGSHSSGVYRRTVLDEIMMDPERRAKLKNTIDHAMEMSKEISRQRKRQ